MEEDSIHSIVQKYNPKPEYIDTFLLVNALYLHIRQQCEKCKERCSKVMGNWKD